MVTKSGRSFGVSLMLAGFVAFILGLKGFNYTLTTITINNTHHIGINIFIIGVVLILVGILALR